MVSTAESIVGPLDVRIITVCSGTDPEHVRQRVSSAITDLDTGAGVLVLTDLCGSTPANMCQSVVRQLEGCEVLSGLNLPMLIKLSTCDRTAGAPQLAEELLDTSRRSIVVGSPS